MLLWQVSQLIQKTSLPPADSMFSLTHAVGMVKQHIATEIVFP